MSLDLLEDMFGWFVFPTFPELDMLCLSLLVPLSALQGSLPVGRLWFICPRLRRDRQQMGAFSAWDWTQHSDVTIFVLASVVGLGARARTQHNDDKKTTFQHDISPPSSKRHDT